MKEEDVYNNRFDWRFDLVAACLIEKGYDPEQILVVRRGGSRRGISTDIEKVAQRHSGFRPEDNRLQIETNRPALYDMLPEGLFHTSAFPGRNKTREEMLEEIRIHRQEEFYIRRFFELFEGEIDHTLVDLQLTELRYDKRNTHEAFTHLFRTFWPEIAKMSLRSANLFVELLPRLHEIRRRTDSTAQAFSLVLDAPVQIKQVYPEKKPEIRQVPRLGSVRLGVNFILRGMVDDGQADLQVSIGDIPARRVKEFLTGKGAELIRFLSGLMLPADREVSVKLTVIPTERKLRLAGKESPYPCYLGINTYL